MLFFLRICTNWNKASITSSLSDTGPDMAPMRSSNSFPTKDVQKGQVNAVVIHGCDYFWKLLFTQHPFLTSSLDCVVDCAISTLSLLLGKPISSPRIDRFLCLQLVTFGMTPRTGGSLG